MSDTDKQVDEALAAMGVAFSAHYIGEAVKWEGQAVDHYRVIIGKFETDYYMGLGNRGPAPKPTDGGPAPRWGTLMHAQLEAQRMRVESRSHTGRNLVAVSMPGAKRFERAVIILTDAPSIEGVTS